MKELKPTETKTCRICNGNNLIKVLSLGNQPWCNNFLSEEDLNKEEPRYPLELLFCNDCSLVQLSYTVPKEVMFVNHPYVSSTTKSLKAHFAKIASKVVKRFSLKSDFVVDIGSNDGTLLQQYKDLGLKVLGVESGKKQANLANESGIETLNEFFNEKTSELIIKKYGKASVISAAGVFFHLEELHSVVKGIKKLLASKGIFIIQAIYLPKIIENVSFDNIYHEHLLYYTLHTLSKLLSQYDLEVFDVEQNSIHGGIIIAYVSHQNVYTVSENVKKMEKFENEEGFLTIEKYKEFAKKAYHIKSKLIKLLTELKNDGKIIYGYGAPAKGNTLLNFCEIDSKYLEFLVEKNELKCNHYAPGSRLKVIHENEVTKIPDYQLVLAWNFLDEFLIKEQSYLKKGGKFIVAIPEPHIIGN